MVGTFVSTIILSLQKHFLGVFDKISSTDYLISTFVPSITTVNGSP